ncbi:MAG TPA: ATP12 family protein [Devosia sp.]|nr:ATP12 family protein [Devosia sp.]
MREFLEDAEGHRDDGYGRAQAHAKRQLPKRFYAEAAVKAVEGGYAVGLDGRVPKTPGMKPVVVPSEAVAQAMAAEWAAQAELIDPQTMPLTRIVNSAVEAGDDAIPGLRAEIVRYAGNDLLLYRADAPETLVRRQEDVWDAVLVKLARHFDIKFQPTIGVVHQAQPAPTLARLDAALGAEEVLPLAALNVLTSITGSGLLAIAHRAGLIDAETMWAAAHVDEDHNIALWGEVEEITVRRAQRRSEFDAAVRLLALPAR